MIQIFDYNFSKKSGELDICNFLINLEEYLLEYNTIKQEEQQIINNFYSIVLNLQKLIAFIGVNYTWLPTNVPPKNIVNNDLITHVKQSLYNIIIKGFHYVDYANIIFIFHEHAPFTYIIERTYKLLIHTFTSEQNNYYNVQHILSIILSNAATNNNYYAIKTLIFKYNVSPIIAISQPPATNHIVTQNTIPIIQIFTKDFTQNYKSYFIVSPQEKEYNFLLMLHKINFCDPNIERWKIQKIFRCVLQNNLKLALNYLLEQKMFWTKLTLEEEDIIIMAYILIAQLEQSNLINITLNHPNILNNAVFKATLVKQHINDYINIINQIIYLNNPSNRIFKIIMDFTKYFSALNYDNNLIYAELISKLRQANQRLENIKSIYILEINKLEEQLKKMTLDTRSLHNTAIQLSEKYNYLLSQFYQIYSKTNHPTQPTLKHNILRHNSF